MTVPLEGEVCVRRSPQNNATASQIKNYPGDVIDLYLFSSGGKFEREIAGEVKRKSTQDEGCGKHQVSGSHHKRRSPQWAVTLSVLSFCSGMLPRRVGQST